MTAYTRTPAQSLAIAQQKAAGFVITKEASSKVEMRRSGSIIIVLQDGTVRRGQSGHQSGSRGNGARRFA